MDQETGIDPPWEPPLSGTEVQQLIGALDRQRWTFRWKADGLDETGLRAGFGASTLTLAGLLKHLTLVEYSKFAARMDAEPLGAPWSEVDWDADPDWEFRTALQDTPQELYAMYDAAVLDSRRRLTEMLAHDTLDREVNSEWHLSLRRLLFDLLEEYGRHTGHADLIRENVDGRVGEDPPADWRVSAWEVSS